jgi:histone chaperone ASF1
VGSASSNQHDQELDSVLVGPVSLGINKFTFDAQAPDVSKIPSEDLVGATIIFLSGYYNDKEFVRVGFFVNVEYEDAELQENPPAKPIVEKLKRSILAEKPRVTTYPITWDDDVEK